MNVRLYLFNHQDTLAVFRDQITQSHEDNYIFNRTKMLPVPDQLVICTLGDCAGKCGNA